MEHSADFIDEFLFIRAWAVCRGFASDSKLQARILDADEYRVAENPFFLNSPGRKSNR